MINDGAKWASEIEKVVSTAKTSPSVIRNSFKDLYPTIFKLPYCVLFRQHLEYAVSVWNQCFLGIIHYQSINILISLSYSFFLNL